MKSGKQATIAFHFFRPWLKQMDQYMNKGVIIYYWCGTSFFSMS